MTKQRKTRPIAAKLRSGLHRPTQAFRSAKTYYRPKQKQVIRREKRR